MAPSEGALASVRRQIDRLDGRLLHLLNERASLALAIGRIKKRRTWPVYDATREAFVLRHMVDTNTGPLSSSAVRHIFQAVLCECRRRERMHARRQTSPRNRRSASRASSGKA